MALKLADDEGGNTAVVLPAAYLHDIVNLPKDHPKRAQASRMAAAKAQEYLVQLQYPEEHHEAIAAAIVSHSFSANIEAQSLEAKIVQDADRLDSLGAIGVTRCFATGTKLERRFYDLDDPFAQGRSWDDLKNTVDHFYVKLFRLEAMLNTASARKEAHTRITFMKDFLRHFQREIEIPGLGEARPAVTVSP